MAMRFRQFLGWCRRHFSTHWLTRPGITNFLIFLVIWYLLISLYIPSTGGEISSKELYLYYTRYSWPNFLLSYVLFIFVIPHYLKRKAYQTLFAITFVLMILFVVIRYRNNIYWDPNYYGSPSGRTSLLSIFPGELFRVFQFTMVAFAFRFYLEWRIGEDRKSELEFEKLRAELSGLRYRMNPHFLLNSMNNIYYLSMVNSSQTPQAIMKLSELLRYTLHEKEDRVLLKREIEHLQTFLDFHLIRYPDYQMDVQVSVSEHHQMAMVPPLLFITFAENAFKHGDPNTSDFPTRISIQTTDNTLHYEVENRINTHGTALEKNHTGLITLQKRLFLHYGTSFSMDTKVRDSIFTAALHIPLQP